MRGRVRVAAGGFLLAVALVGWWAVRNRLPERVTLLSEGARVGNFRHMDELFPSRAIHRSGEEFRFASADRSLDPRFEYAGRTITLDDFLARTTTTGLLVVKDDAVVLERYFLGAGPDSRFTSFSVAKSFVSALVGIALADGRIPGVDTPVSDVATELRGSGYEGVPLRDVLQMSSGIAFDEDYENPLSDVNVMFAKSFLLGTSIDDYPRRLRSREAAGRRFEYVSVDTQVLGMVLRAATGRSLADLLSEQIWGPMGAGSDATWIVDSEAPDAREYAFCCINATLRDFARFGSLYLHGGRRGGRQVVPEAWVRESLVPGRPDLVNAGHYTPDWAIGYGYQWWLPTGDSGEFMAIGVWGQYVYVAPADRVVIAKTSADPGFDLRDMETLAAFRAIVAALREPG